jgi:hypothetical protein
MATEPFVGPVMKREPPCPSSSVSYKAAVPLLTVSSYTVPITPLLSQFHSHTSSLLHPTAHHLVKQTTTIQRHTMPSDDQSVKGFASRLLSTAGSHTWEWITAASHDPSAEPVPKDQTRDDLSAWFGSLGPMESGGFWEEKPSMLGQQLTAVPLSAAPSTAKPSTSRWGLATSLNARFRRKPGGQDPEAGPEFRCEEDEIGYEEKKRHTPEDLV